VRAQAVLLAAMARAPALAAVPAFRPGLPGRAAAPVLPPAAAPAARVPASESVLVPVWAPAPAREPARFRVPARGPVRVPLAARDFPALQTVPVEEVRRMASQDARAPSREA